MGVLLLFPAFTRPGTLSRALSLLSWVGPWGLPCTVTVLHLHRPSFLRRSPPRVVLVMVGPRPDTTLAIDWHFKKKTGLCAVFSNHSSSSLRCCPVCHQSTQDLRSDVSVTGCSTSNCYFLSAPLGFLARPFIPFVLCCSAVPLFPVLPSELRALEPPLFLPPW